ncbi:kinase [Thermoplasmatales archaeon SG8-52-4]|nr:MAG: kinase [Thermoplasmatales archaeon SG8-52-4]
MIIVKLGGSVITEKSKEGTFRKKVMDNLAEKIKKANRQIIIIHGAGSFGHIQAKKYRLNEGFKSEDQLYGFSVTHEMVQRLNTMVLKSLQSYSIPAVSIPPNIVVKFKNHELTSIDYKIFEEYLDKKLIPVTFGDVVLDKKFGFSVCSGDILTIALTNHFKPDKVIFVIDEDGLYTSNPKLYKNAQLIESTTIKNLKNLKTSKDKHDDVTGGMSGKIKTIKKISELGIDTILLNGNKPERLYKVLVGEGVKSTIVYGEKK